MVKKLFALASVTALTGLVSTVAAAGCSSSSTSENPGAADTGAPAVDGGKKDTGAKDPVDASEEEEDSGPGTCPTTDPITSADIDKELPWKAPAAVQSVCTQKNIDDLRAAFDASKEGVTFTNIEKALGATCSACVFSADKEGTNWQPFVKVGTAGNAIDNGFSSCLAQVKDAACGKAYFAFDNCLSAACTEDACGSQEAVQACWSKAVKGACKEPFSGFTTACPDIDAQGTKCDNIFLQIVQSCGGGQDGGIDASIPEET